MVDSRHYFNIQNRQSGFALQCPGKELVLERSWDRSGSILRIEFPNVDEVFLSGPFNRWSIPGKPMHRVCESTWETQVQVDDEPRTVGCFGLVNGRIVQKRFYVVRASNLPDRQEQAAGTAPGAAGSTSSNRSSHSATE